MHSETASQRQLLDENLQIVRATLAAIQGDIRGFSTDAADAVVRAVEHLDRARREFSRRPVPRWRPGLHALE